MRQPAGGTCRPPGSRRPAGSWLRTSKFGGALSPTVSGYVVEIKRSARLASAAAGRWVNREGPLRTFPTKALARQWGRELSGPGNRVWVQDAVPADPTDADGYVVAGARTGRRNASGTQRAIAAGRSEPSGDAR